LHITNHLFQEALELKSDPEKYRIIDNFGKGSKEEGMSLSEVLERFRTFFKGNSRASNQESGLFP